MVISFREISLSEHDKFLTGHKKEHFMQTSVWGEIKTGGGAWHMQTVGMFYDNTVVASAMLLWRKLPAIGKKLYYAPRGFIIDFDDWDMVRSFTHRIKEFIKAQARLQLTTVISTIISVWIH